MRTVKYSINWVITKVINGILAVIHKLVEGIMYFFAVDGKKAFLNADNYPWHTAFEMQIDDIQKEASIIFSDRSKLASMENISKEQETIAEKNTWIPFFLHAYGNDVVENQQKCPKTTALINSVPDMVMAFFSCLEPQAGLEPHRGIFKGVVRYHLGLKVPSSDNRCGLTVNGEYRPWIEGKSFIFDDSMVHYAENETQDYRIVLIIDVERKMPRWLSRINKKCINFIAESQFIKEAVNNQVSSNKSIY